MGLDMYLIAKRHFYAPDWKDKDDEEKIICKKIREVIPEMYESGNLNSIDIEFEVGYWRKANQIHNWFVINVQDGVDECQRTYVSRDDLIALRNICKQVIESSEMMDGSINAGTRWSPKEGEKTIWKEGKVVVDTSVAEDLLPTTSGFFFGSTDYDEWYINNLKYTIEAIDKALRLPKGWTFEYHSSW